MKKIVASVGLVALGSSGLHADQISGTMTDPSKPWSVSATLRGFYDDNVDTQHSNGTASAGWEVNPAIGFYTQWEGTRIGASYQYTFKYYDNKPPNNTDHFDQTHNFDFALNHSFSPRYKIAVQDSFAIGQEPDVLRAGNSFATFQRVPGDNLRNYGLLNFDSQLTPVFGIAAGYANTLFKYADDNGTIDNPSQAGLLNRIENAINIDGHWILQPQTIGVLGYMFRYVDYTAGEEIGVLANGDIVHSDDRNSVSHYFYVGADHTFLPTLVGSGRVGARFIEYPNESQGSGNQVAPYVNLNLSYTYAPQSYLSAGFSFDMNATDAFSVQGDSITQNEESAVFYASLNHRITPKLFGSVVFTFQDSMFYGGSLDGETEQYYLIGLNLKYHFTPHFSAEVGYNYDLVDSDVPQRAYDRNRVYIGVTAAY